MSWRHWPLSERTFWQEKMWYAAPLYSFDNDWQYGCISTRQSLCLCFYIVILGLTPGIFVIFDHIAFLMKCLNRDNLPCWEALIHLTPIEVTCVLRKDEFWVKGQLNLVNIDASFPLLHGKDALTLRKSSLYCLFSESFMLIMQFDSSNFSIKGLDLMECD